MRLRSEFGVYGIDTGRICVAALNSKNIDYVAHRRIAKVMADSAGRLSGICWTSANFPLCRGIWSHLSSSMRPLRCIIGTALRRCRQHPDQDAGSRHHRSESPVHAVSTL